MIYGCQDYNKDRLCRFDRRAVDQMCVGCQRKTDSDYLAKNGLLVPGVSHQKDDEYHAAVV